MKARILSALIALLFAASVVHAQAKIHPDVAHAVKDNNRFAIELYGNLAVQDGNVFLSPYSISTALAMTYAGARGETAAQMAKTLHYTLPGDKLHAVFGALIREQNDHDGKQAYKLRVANRLWGQKQYTFHDDFLQLVKKNYGAGLQEVDFVKDAEGARKTINDWVAKETHGKIKDLVPENVLDSDSRLVLTNAIYFKAAWFDEFAVGETKKGDFWTTAKEKVQANLMHRNATYDLVDQDTFQLLDMPYENNDLSMIVILPKRKDGLKEIERTLKQANLDDWLKAKKPYTVDVKLPRFKFTATFGLRTTLEEMGMPLAFSPGADFAGVGSPEKLFIKDVIHKAFVDVDEKGTEAAAATAVFLRTLGRPFRPELEANFHADHPFVFLIRDNRNGSILFVGRVVNPS
jgi:serine protease inhibitor